MQIRVDAMEKQYSSRSAELPHVVVIGGGTGLSTMLRGLKRLTPNITAIVSVADDGGGSGMLRSELGMLPPGDIRNCIQALAGEEPTMEALLGYRFTEGSLKGQSFGNLFLAALNGMSSSFDAAVAKMSAVLNITGRVLPVTNENVNLAAEFDDGTEIFGESHIREHKLGTPRVIRRVRLLPEHSAALPACMEAVEQADLIVLGPGSLYTSILPNLLTDGLSEAISRSEAVRVYILNVMTEPGETEDYTASDHIRAIQRHTGARLFDFCLANDSPIPPEIAERYALTGSVPVALDADAVTALGVELVTSPIADSSTQFVRHDSDALARALLNLYREHSPTRVYHSVRP